MWTIYGVASANVTDVTNPRSVIVGDFKPTEIISEADFNNRSNVFLAYDMGLSSPAVYPSNNGVSKYVAPNSFPTNLLFTNRFNILHRKAENGVIKYDYDKCYYEWIYHTSGSNVYYFDGYNKDSISYSHCPSVAFSSYTNNEITRDMVNSLQLIATKNSDGTINVCRPLWGLDLSSVTLIGTHPFKDNPIQFVLGTALPDSLIREWLNNTKENDEDNPLKPMLNPEDANQATGTMTGVTFKNKFKIMNWPDNAPWPNKFLIEGYPASSAEFFADYSCYNHDNDPDNYYHIEQQYTGDSTLTANFWTSLQQKQKNINDEKSEAGHDILYCSYENTDIYFTTHNNNIDNIPVSFTYGRLNDFDNNLTLGDDLTVNYSGVTGRYINGILFNNTFRISTNYPNNTNNFPTGMPNTGGNTPSSFLDACIVRYQGHYYIGGWFKFGTQYSSGGFIILCRMDNLDEMPNHGGSNPGDPTGDGLDKNDLDDIFGDGTLTEPNPTTDSLINNSIGDTDPADNIGGSGGTGSAYDENGNPIIPGGGTGTGEKNTNPVDTGPNGVPNTHDGSMGNGTGDPHQGDTAITDPASTLPTGTDADGTVSGSGVLQVFTPTLAQLTTFTSELLSNTVLDSIKNYFTTNPMDGIFSLHMLPYTGFSSNSTANPRIGTHTFTSALNLASDEYINVDYSYVDVPFVYDGYENFAPYSDAKIFLPFIGMKDIDINIIQGCRCTLKYNISLVTGDVYAYLYAQWNSKWNNAGTLQGVDHLVYQWQGNCAATIPLSHLDSTNYISGAMQIAGGITSLVAGAASANPFAIPSGVAGVTQGIADIGRTSLITSGNVSGMAAFMGCREPYFIFSRPIIAFSNAYNHYLGLRSNAIQKIGQLRHGTFTKMRNVDLKGIPATNDELNEIDSILKGGFYA